MSAWEEANGQLGLFPAPEHEHVFKVMQGPHVKLPEDTYVFEANPQLWRPHPKTMRYCWGCRHHIYFDHLGNEMPRDRIW